MTTNLTLVGPSSLTWAWTIGFHRARLLTDLETVIRERALTTWWQPIIDLKTSSRVYGHAVQTRITHHTFADPARFFDLIEACGLSGDVAPLLYARYSALLLTQPGQTLFLKCRPDDLVRLMGEQGAIYSLIRNRARHLCLEFSEEALFAPLPMVRNRLQQARDLGFRIAVSQLGAGFSTLRWLDRIRPDVVKLDPGVVRRIHQRPVLHPLIDRLARFCLEMPALLAAEGVDSEEERRCLHDLGCMAGQGMHLGKPVQLDDLPVE